MIYVTNKNRLQLERLVRYSNIISLTFLAVYAESQKANILDESK